MAEEISPKYVYDEGRQVGTRMGVGDDGWVCMTIVVCEGIGGHEKGPEGLRMRADGRVLEH